MPNSSATNTRSATGHRRATPLVLVLVGLIAAAGAVAGVVLFQDSPTLWPAADAVYRAALVGLCALAGSRARRWTLLWGGLVAAAASYTPSQYLALVAALLAGAMLVFKFRQRVLGAAVGALCGLAVLGLSRPTTSGITALIAAVAILPLLVTGYAQSRTQPRRVVAVITGIFLLLGAVAIATTVFVGLTQRSAVEAAVEQTRTAVEIASSDSPEGSTAAFTQASESFNKIESTLNSWWLAPAKATPILGPNLELLRTAAQSGTELNLVGSTLSTTVTKDALRSPNGGVNLAEVEAIQLPVTNAAAKVDAAVQSLDASKSPWLLPPLNAAFQDLSTELNNANETARTAEMSVMRLPNLLGADGPRRYVMLLGNPAESRDIGGHIGNWAELTAQDGILTLVKVGQPYDLASPATSPPLTLKPGAYPPSLLELRPQYFPQNWGGTADFPTVAALSQELFEQARPGAAVDGVIYADPAAFAALLNFTGPEPVPGTDLVLTPDNAEKFLTTDQFTVFKTETQANQVVSDLIDNVVRQFGTTQLPSPKSLVNTLGPLVKRGSLQFYSFDKKDLPLLERLGLTGRVQRPGSGDLLSVLTRNANPSKIDVYLERKSEYIVDWDPLSGDLTAKLKVTLTNSAPATDLADVVATQIPTLPPGTNRTIVSVLSPWTVDSASLDGKLTTIGTQPELAGILRHNLLVDLPPGSTRVIELELQGTTDQELPYRIAWIGQPTANRTDSMKMELITQDVRTGQGSASSFHRFAGDQDELYTFANSGL